MLKGTDDAAFSTLMQDLCTAFNRPYTPDLSRVFWETLKHVSLHEVRRACDSAKRNLRKFPAPRDLIPERRYAPVAPPDVEPFMSKWAVAANKALFACAYGDLRRGTKAIAIYPPMPEKGWGLPLPMPPKALDNTALENVLRIKRDLVEMAESADREGLPMDGMEYSDMLRAAFRQALNRESHSTKNCESFATSAEESCD